MDNIFHPIKFRTSVQLDPRQLTRDFEDNILKKLKKDLEGICSRFGYIRQGTLEIIKRSTGVLLKPHFNGHIKFDVVCRAFVCNPVEGFVVPAIIKNKNQLGILAESSILVDSQRVPILDIIIPQRSAGIISEVDLDSFQIGDMIMVEVIGKRSQLFEKKMSIIGRAVNSQQGGTIESEAASQENEIEEESLEEQEQYDFVSEEEDEPDEEEEREDEGEIDDKKIIDIDDDFFDQEDPDDPDDPDDLEDMDPDQDLDLDLDPEPDTEDP